MAVGFDSLKYILITFKINFKPIMRYFDQKTFCRCLHMIFKKTSFYQQENIASGYVRKAYNSSNLSSNNILKGHKLPDV